MHGYSILSFLLRGRSELYYQREFCPGALPTTECVSLIVKFRVVKPIDLQIYITFSNVSLIS